MSQITMTQVREAHVTLLNAQKTATPALLKKVSRYRPGSVLEAPVVWVGDQIEDILYDSGTRNRVVLTEVIVAVQFPADNLTATDPIDELQDAVRERLTTGYNTIPDTILELIRVESGEVSFQGTDRPSIYRALTFNTRLRIWENRL